MSMESIMAELEMRLNGGDGNDEDEMSGMKIQQNSQEESDDKDYAPEANGLKGDICELKEGDEGDDLAENSKNLAKYLPLDVAQSREFNIQLIQLVRSRPELYDTTSSGYKNVELRHQEWSVISEKLQQNVDFVKTRWKTMRDRFKKEHRKYLNNQPIQWAHFDDMIFLLPFFRKGTSETPTSKKENNNINGDELRNGADNLNLNDKELTDMSHATNFIINFAKSVVNDSGSGATRSLFLDEKCNLSVGGDGATGSSSDPASPASNYNERQGSTANGDLSHNNNGNHFDLSDFGGGVSTHSSSRKRKSEDVRRLLPSCALLGDSLSAVTRIGDYDSPVNGGGVGSVVAAAVSNSFNVECDDEEDELFCRIMMKKLKKMAEPAKEKAKAKMLDVLVHFQYSA